MWFHDHRAQAFAAPLVEAAKEIERLRGLVAAEREACAELEAALTEIRDLLPIEQDNYSRRVFNIAADALEKFTNS